MHEVGDEIIAMVIHTHWSVVTPPAMPSGTVDRRV
jgi:hypothetical protein